MKQSDILLVARPDQSLDIYKALSAQKELTFLMITFKVVRTWVKKLIPYHKFTTVGGHCRILWLGTFKHLARRYRFGKNWSDADIFDATAKRCLRRRVYRIIHFWPDNGGKTIVEYGRTHPDCFVIADIHMPFPLVVFEEMKTLYEKYEIDSSKLLLRKLVDEQMHYLDGVENVLVPSSYVADTFRTFFPDKNYFVVPYGITISKYYQKRHKNTIRDFIFAGFISLEKGVELVLNYFVNHPELNLHLFGCVNSSQAFVFDKYKGKDNIFFHGHLSRPELMEQISHYDVGIHMSRFDAYSLAVSQMIGSGKPVIISEKTGNLDDVNRYGFGIVSKLDDESLVQAIERMLDPEVYNGFVDNIDKYVKDGHQNYGEKMIEFYKEHLHYFQYADTSSN